MIFFLSISVIGSLRLSAAIAHWRMDKSQETVCCRKVRARNSTDSVLGIVRARARLHISPSRLDPLEFDS